MSIPPILSRFLRLMTTAILGFLLLIAGLLLGCQRSLIYFPTHYQPAVLQEAQRKLTTIRYDSLAGKQAAFYVPPREGEPLRPERLWMLFSGNAAQALDWLDFVENHPDPRAAFLLFDYPGYGVNEGKPQRGTIIDAAEEALKACARQMTGSEEIENPPCPLGIVGHSLGAAAAMEMAARNKPDRVVLISPFTDLMTMARGSVGWPLCWLLLDRYDNAARLKDLAEHSPRPAVTILHGTEDDIIPFEMGKALAERWPDWIAFVPCQNGDHNMLLDYFKLDIYAAMGRSHSESDTEESANAIP